MRLIYFNSNIIINLFEARWSRESTNMARKVIKACNLQRNGISIMLSNDKQIQKLNHKWKGKNRPTNVLSFPNHEEFLKRKTQYIK